MPESRTHLSSHSPETRSSRRPGLGGDEQRLFIRHANSLRRVVANEVVTSAANVDDACAYAWMQLVAYQPRRDTVFAWLCTVAIREAWRLDALDRRVTGSGRLAPEVPVDPEGEDRIVLCEAIELLGTIHPRRRGMLVMQVAGFSCEEIADRHGISVTRARELIYRARLELRERAGLEGVDPRSRK